jgi:hypothetical protein
MIYTQCQQSLDEDEWRLLSGKSMEVMDQISDLNSDVQQVELRLEKN